MQLAKRTVELGGPPLVAMGAACLLQSLPQGVLDFLTAWMLVSLPVGIVVGHCALSED
ncbi:MAG: hypothetical protein U1E70_01255 [Acetobacteraceae bacterium]|nr:hypothetical protein [Pseudomonadota bacterium]